MPAYDIHGNQLDCLYGLNGQRLEQAYDIDGNPLFEKEPEEPTEIVVMSYNVGQWYAGYNQMIPNSVADAYYTLQRGIMATHRPAIAAFQEYASTFSSGKTTQSVIGEYFTNSFVNNKSGYQIKATYTNGYPMSDIEDANYSGATWGYIKCKVTIGGKDVWIFNTHLATSSTESEKVREAKLLFDMVSQLDRFIILGDFNTVCLSVNDTEYTTIMKQYIDAGFRIANCSPQFGFNPTWTESTDQNGTWYPCDHIITSSNIQMKNVEVDLSKIPVCSELGVRIDHCPIVATLVV